MNNFSGTEKVFADSIMKDKDHIISIMESIIEITKIINSANSKSASHIPAWSHLPSK